MARNMHSGLDLSGLSWKRAGSFQVAWDERYYCIREGMGSIIAGFVFGVLISASAGWLGVSILFFPELAKSGGTLGEKAFAGFMLLVAAVFLWIVVSCLRRGRWMVVFDRQAPGEIRTNTTCVPVAKVRAFSTRSVGGKMPRSTVVVELHDGKWESVGPVDMAGWTANFAQHAANWLGVPYRHTGH